MNKELVIFKELQDSDGNTFWELPVPHGVGIDYYRIRKKLKDNKIVYYDDSDDALCTYGHKEEWLDLNDAKYYFYKLYDTIVK